VAFPTTPFYAQAARLFLVDESAFVSLPGEVSKADLKALIEQLEALAETPALSFVCAQGWDRRIRALDHLRWRRAVSELRTPTKVSKPFYNFGPPPLQHGPTLMDVPDIFSKISVSGREWLSSGLIAHPAARVATLSSFSTGHTYSFAPEPSSERRSSRGHVVRGGVPTLPLPSFTWSSSDLSLDFHLSFSAALDAVIMRGHRDEDDGQPSPVTLDHYSMLTLTALIELSATRSSPFGSRGTYEHYIETLNEQTRQRRALADCVVHLVHYSDADIARDEEAFPLPMHLYHAALNLPVFRDEDWRRAEIALAAEIERAYAIWVSTSKAAVPGEQHS